MSKSILRLLVLADCAVNFILRGEVTETLSSRAHRMRDRKQPVWGWTADAIDLAALKLFGQKDHCRKAYEAERAGGALTWMPRWLFVEIF